MKSIYFPEATASFGPPRGWDSKTQGVCHNLVLTKQGDRYISLMFFNEIPAEKFFKNCKAIGHQIDG